MRPAKVISMLNQRINRWELTSDSAYQDWRVHKLDALSHAHELPFVTLKNLAKPSESERSELITRCKTQNIALYQCADKNQDSVKIRNDLRGFTAAMGLKTAEMHRSAGDRGIVSLVPTATENQRGYIPYSRKAMNWHTDGYYNQDNEKIRAMVLHCVRPADDGGQNQLLDPEVAYIRLRDENPAFIAALMHPAAMTIPANTETDGSVRPASIGPVFAVDPQNGALSMRYTARTRSISWRNDPDTTNAVAYLQNLLQSGDPLMQTVTFAPGQGVLCNNVLHNRTGFDPVAQQKSNRMVLRIRFHNRVKGS